MNDLCSVRIHKVGGREMDENKACVTFLGQVLETLSNVQAELQLLRHWQSLSKRHLRCSRVVERPGRNRFKRRIVVFSLKRLQVLLERALVISEHDKTVSQKKAHSLKDAVPLDMSWVRIRAGSRRVQTPSKRTIWS